MFIFPMAGASRRFAEAGYTLPKYKLQIGRMSVFEKAVCGFSSYFKSHPFLFIARNDDPDVEDFIKNQCAAMGVENPITVILDQMTAGQAETVEIGLKRSGYHQGGPISIFNIDTFRPSFSYPAKKWMHCSDGYLEVFEGSGANWSYVRPVSAHDSVPYAAETAEKKPISNLCCTGLYHFARAEYFLSALTVEKQNPSAKELFVAPLYNHLIQDGKAIHYHLIRAQDVIFCGVPEEYEVLRSGS
ncbi:MAG: capsular biosynthesis protein [Sphingomonadales bacterium]|nr:capsular biosynthesis protein [Sphingomonadales bacterium]